MILTGFLQRERIEDEEGDAIRMTVVLLKSFVLLGFAYIEPSCREEALSTHMFTEECSYPHTDALGGQGVRVSRMVYPGHLEVHRRHRRCSYHR